ncbi:hypothetical protein Vadar_004845 [Vaccinium darrowii]|uniref:Uncharacterized protein n=1 Tax=Vaccinium darrowii TaxID=229202 RepID=A0ACB7YJ11_9ERIC|nr:hypothetical protein Vadar_004845 [Vaccinium darrowii]
MGAATQYPQVLSTVVRSAATYSSCIKYVQNFHVKWNTRCTPNTLSFSLEHLHIRTTFSIARPATSHQPASFLCHACGDDHKAVSFKCGCCPFWVHQSCTLLPSTLKHSDQDHLLTLARSLPDEYSIFSPSCDICCKEVYALIWVNGNEVFTMNWVYYCAGCRYFAHVNCATSKRETSGDEEARIEVVLDPNPILLPVANSSLDLVAQFVKRSNLEEIKMTTKLEHFGHGHPLILFDEQMSNELSSGSKGNLCEACVEPILAPFYGCTQCNYFLHKCCAELPTKIWHPFHTEHPLDLLPEASEERSLNWCECCFKPCNGFSFKCSQCPEFCLDVKCGSLSGPIKHVAHKHLLTPKSVPVKYCSACGRLLPTKFGFVCDLCDFILDTRCAMLPSAFKHRYDKHPVILTYSPIKNHPAEYYCELCEEEVNPKHWFYHCVDCDQSIDIWCMYRYNYLLDLTIKKGESLKFDSHPHPLTVIGFSKDPGFFCNGCGNLYKYSLLPWLECGPCKLKLHLKCAGDAVKKGEVL